MTDWEARQKADKILLTAQKCGADWETIRTPKQAQDLARRLVRAIYSDLELDKYGNVANGHGNSDRTLEYYQLYDCLRYSLERLAHYNNYDWLGRNPDDRGYIAYGFEFKAGDGDVAVGDWVVVWEKPRKKGTQP